MNNSYVRIYKVTYIYTQLPMSLRPRGAHLELLVDRLHLRMAGQIDVLGCIRTAWAIELLFASARVMVRQRHTLASRLLPTFRASSSLLCSSYLIIQVLGLITTILG
jgi:hypothetical protein